MTEPFIFDEQYTNINDSIPYIKWKGKTFFQLSSVLQLTQNTNQNTFPDILFRAGPQRRIYRREIVTNTTSKGNPRISSSIEELNSPNGYLVYHNATDTAINNCDGLVETLDDTLPNDQSELGNTCKICNYPENCVSTSTTPLNACFSVELNARRRVRSAGMIKKTFVPSKNNDTNYFTDNRQYLVSRNRSIDQNSYAYIRQGNPVATPGAVGSKSNVYSPAGLSHCTLTTISASLGNNVFDYVWVDGLTYTATIPDATNYDINSFNDAFQQILINNKHYYTNNFNSSKNFLLIFSYNTLYGKVELQAIAASNYTNPQYSIPAGASWVVSQQVPQFQILNTGLQQALGFGAGFYPTSNILTTTQIIIGSSVGSLNPPYVALYYKPSNYQFGVQGGVESSALIARKKYDAITNNGFAYRNAYGASVADAMAYNVCMPGYNVYTLKDKIGYPNKLIPKFPKFSTQAMQKCTPKRFSYLY